MLAAAQPTPAQAAWKLCVVKVCGDEEICRHVPPGTHRAYFEYPKPVSQLCHKAIVCTNRLVDCPN